jgi:hypothetical protein
MAVTHLMMEPAFMCDEKGFQCCDALQTSGATLIKVLIFGIPQLPVHEKETVKVKDSPGSVAWRPRNSKGIIPKT